LSLPNSWKSRGKYGHGKTLNEREADSICAKIAKGLEVNKIVGTANVITYAMKESWLAGFEEGRKYPLKELE
jgi:hypothetical protein